MQHKMMAGGVETLSDKVKFSLYMILLWLIVISRPMGMTAKTNTSLKGKLS